MVESFPYCEGPVEEEPEEDPAQQIERQISSELDIEIVVVHEYYGQYFNDPEGEFALQNYFYRLEEVDIVERWRQQFFILVEMVQIPADQVQALHQAIRVIGVSLLEDHTDQDIEQFIVVEKVDAGLHHAGRIPFNLYVLHLVEEGTDKLVVAWEVLPLYEFYPFAQLGQLRDQEIEEVEECASSL